MLAKHVYMLRCFIKSKLKVCVLPSLRLAAMAREQVISHICRKAILMHKRIYRELLRGEKKHEPNLH